MNEPNLRISSPTDLAAAVPYLLGFTPVDSLVVIGLRRKRVFFELRLDLPDPAGRQEMAEYVAAVAARQDLTATLLVGYGSDDVIAPLAWAVQAALEGKDVSVLEMLRIEDGRYWSYVCANPDCCPPSGTSFDVSTSRVAAEATFAGLARTDSREDLVTRLAPATGEERVTMTRETVLAEARLARMRDAHPNSSPESLVIGAGMSAVDEAISQLSRGDRLGDDVVAWLSLLLTSVAVRDYAWDLVGEDVPLHQALWFEVTRRVSPELAAPAATLLAYASWRGGEGAVTTIALERAFAADPDYRMAHLLRRAIEGGVSPREYLGLCENRMAQDEGGKRRRPAHRGGAGEQGQRGGRRGRRGRHSNRGVTPARR